MAERFFKLYERLLYDERLSYPEMILYSVILSLSNNSEHKCFASNQALAKLMHCSKSSIGKWLNALTEYGYITRSVHYADGTKHIDKRYIAPVTIYTADLQGDIPQNDDRVYRNGGIPSTAVLQEGIPRTCEDNKINIIREYNKINYKDKFIREKIHPIITQFKFNDDLFNAVNEWVAYKEERGELSSDDWLKGQIELIASMADKYGDNAVIALLRKCIANGWKTIPTNSLTDSNNFFLKLSASGGEDLF